MTSMLCSEGAIWAVPLTAGEGQPEEGVEPLQGTRAPAGGPRTGKRVWLLHGSACGEASGDQAGRASLPSAPAPLPAGGSGLCRFAGAVVPGPLPCQGARVLLLLSAPK